MEISSAKWLSEMELESTFIDDFQMNPLDCTLDDLGFQTFSDESYTSYADLDHSMQTPSPSPSPAVVERPSKQPKTTGSWNSCTTRQIASKATSSSSSHIISFENSKSSPDHDSEKVNYGNVMPKTEMGLGCDGNIDFSTMMAKENQNRSTKNGQGIKRTSASMNRTPNSLAQDHVLAERKRREKLSQRFVALSALIPGLKKMDKASILGQAITHVKELQERVKVAEEQAAKATTVESVVFVNRSNLPTQEDEDSDDQNTSSDRASPDIEARVSDKDVLLRIHGDRRKGCHLSYLLNQIEKLNLTVINSSILPFGHSRLDITIVAQMDDDFCMTVKDLVQKLRQALLIDFV